MVRVLKVKAAPRNDCGALRMGVATRPHSDARSCLVVCSPPVQLRDGACWYHTISAALPHAVSEIYESAAFSAGMRVDTHTR